MGPLVRHTPMVVGPLLIHCTLVWAHCWEKHALVMANPSGLWQWANCWRKYVLAMTYAIGACSKALTEGTLAMGPLLVVTCPLTHYGDGPTAQKYPYGGGPTAENITYGGGPTAQKCLYGGGLTAQNNTYGSGPTAQKYPYGGGPITPAFPSLPWAHCW
ncbi:hypothetical protein BKA93DRAFT_748086 [Sparassis latifolia]